MFKNCFKTIKGEKIKVKNVKSNKRKGKRVKGSPIMMRS